jgi:hypothetical protein
LNPPRKKRSSHKGTDKTGSLLREPKKGGGGSLKGTEKMGFSFKGTYKNRFSPKETQKKRGSL